MKGQGRRNMINYRILWILLGNLDDDDDDDDDDFDDDDDDDDDDDEYDDLMIMVGCKFSESMLIAC